MDDRERRLLIGAACLSRGGVWADLGAGRGAFTLTLATELGPDAVIWAVDRDRPSLRGLERALRAGVGLVHATVRTRVGSFQDDLGLPPLDGLLMANSLHYAEEPEALLDRLSGLLKPNGRFLLVEYDTATPSRWVPHPVPYEAFQRMAPRCGLASPRLLARVRSEYHGHAYSALALRPA